MKVDVIIPVYGPGNRLLELFDRLGREDSRKISPCTM